MCFVSKSLSSVGSFRCYSLVFNASRAQSVVVGNFKSTGAKLAVLTRKRETNNWKAQEEMFALFL